MNHFPTATAVDIERQFDLQPGALGAALTSMIGELPAGLCIRDAAGRFLFVNHRMAAMFERTVAEMIGRSIDDWLDAPGIDELRQADRAAAGRLRAQTSFHSILVDGRRRNFSVTQQAMPCDGEPAAALSCSIWREHAPAGSARESAMRWADSTGWPADGGALPDSAAPAADQSAPVGRALFQDQLRRELDLSSREHREFALVSIAIDGPDPASRQPDEVARQRMEQRVERLLRANIRAMDSSFRVAANSFFMILSGVGLATAHSRVEALRRQCANEAAAIGDDTDQASISIGVASFPHTTREREEIVRAAETAMAVARQRGGNQVALARIAFDES